MARHPAEAAAGMIACILLASGFGRRFGSNKLLYEIDGAPMYQYALELLHTLSQQTINGQTVQVIVVSQYPRIEQHAQRLGMQAVHNADAAEGIAASVRHGVRAARRADWLAFFTADQPELRAETVREFLTQAIQSGKPLASVASEGQPGNPTLFSGAWREQLLQLSGDTGGRKIMKQHPDDIFWFDIPQRERRDWDVPILTNESGFSTIKP